MKPQRTTLLKSFSIAFTLVGVLILAQGQARADEVTISGFTTGTITGVLPGLSFTGNTFTSTMFMNSSALSGANNLGTFSLATVPGQFVGGNFILNITFTSPTGINGGQGTTYTAFVAGNVSPNVNEGGVQVNFDNTPVIFTFSNATNVGTITLALADLFVQSGQSATLTAGTSGVQSVPEPATLLLLGTGLAGIAAKLRKRRKGLKRGLTIR